MTRRMLTVLGTDGPAAYALSRTSSNRKTGPIPVVVAGRQTCPTSCVFRGAGCYAEAWPLVHHWAHVTERSRGTDLDGLTEAIESLPWGATWRYGVAGDLPGAGDVIDVIGLRAIVVANGEGARRGWAYTHKPLDVGDNLAAIAEANFSGFAINVSADNLCHADRPLALGLPVAVVVPDAPDGWRTTETPEGRRVVRCPAEYLDHVSCASCGAGRPLCARTDRLYAIGFTPHGPRRRVAETAARCT